MIVSIDSDEGIVKIGTPAVLLPGILLRMIIAGSLLFESVEIEGSSGTRKQVTGWDDSSIRIEMRLVDDQKDGEIRKSSFEYLKELDSLFKKVERGKPVVYTINNPHARARNIKNVLFSGLESSQTNKGIIVTIEFVEFTPAVAVSQERSAGQQVQKDKAKEQKPIEISDKDLANLNKLEKKLR